MSRQDGVMVERLEQVVEFETVVVDARGQVIERTAHCAQQSTENLEDGIHLDMLAITGGSFLMGAPKSQGYDDERPQHMVTVAPFWLGKYTVTQGQWQAVMGSLPPCRCPSPTKPVDRVAWNDAQKFCARLARLTGRAYRLPSEAEWEYACRAGTTKPFHFGDTLTTDLANYVGEHLYRSEPKGVYRHAATDVGSFPPNAFGLYDMHGNVWEWCADVWHDDYSGAPTDGTAWERGDTRYRVGRGGGWHDPPNLCRSAARLKLAAAEGDDFIGFRVACSSNSRGGE